MSLIQVFISPVAVNIAVNACIAAGFTAITMRDTEEIDDFLPKIDGLLVNLGSLLQSDIPKMLDAAQIFNAQNKPWVLDPVAVGVTSVRLGAALHLLQHTPSIIRGNASEIITLTHALGLVKERGTCKGPDSMDSVETALEPAKALANHTGSVVGVSGAVDIVTDGQRTQRITGGHPLMPQITGLGCAVSTLMACFVTQETPFTAAITAFEHAARAGEVAGRTAGGTGTFQPLWLDALSSQKDLPHELN